MALRQRADAIMNRWTEEVDRYLPHADPLTAKEIRDSIPTVLEKIALALESAEPGAILVLEEVGMAHGVARFQQNYDIEEVIIEYRILRRVVFDELYRTIGLELMFMDAVPVDMGIDMALHRGVVNYVRHLTKSLKSSAERESKFLAFLSHDLRNNLGAAMLRLELLGQQLGAEPQFADAAREVQALQSSVQQTVVGMDRLLQAERLRREKVELKLGPVDLRALADELIARVASEAQAKGLRVENAIPARAAAHSDRELLVLVLQNLLGNAVKYSSKGTVRIESRNETLGWRIFVRDEGPGIAPERMQTLFQAFTRGESHGQKGVGLGLSIASHAARQLGSELSVESTVGQGSMFSFVVPAARPEDSR